MSSSTNTIFNSKTEPIPRIRPDIEIIPIDNNGDSYLYFRDMRGYATPDFALDFSARNLLSLLDGRKSVTDLKPHLSSGTTASQLLQYIQFLDKNRLLHSPHFKMIADDIEKKYERATVHQSITAGSSYPADPNELKTFLDDAFKKYGADEPLVPASIKALYAPHIDPRVGLKSYVRSFERLKNIKPKRVVILATSHYSGLYPDVYEEKPLIVSSKDFEMPLGTIPADKQAIKRLMQQGKDAGLTSRDRAHRIEHSIELHLLFLSYIWQHDFSIIPIIVGGFDELFYTKKNYLARQIDAFSILLRNQFGEDDETLFLISGDLAHTGKKFGHRRPAATMKNEVEQFDEQFLEAGEKGSTKTMLRLMKQNYDPYNICGFPPLYTFLKAFPNMQGQTISYDRWDQTERESAVTFGSILYE